MPTEPLCLAYYCSGHGYGHATRVSAFTRYLLSTPEPERPVVHIVSSAPEHVFADSIACGARYRYAEIDPVIVQPLAYRVDRRKSVEVLKRFLGKKDLLLEREKEWLLEVKAQCVLSDAAFLGCEAARAAGLPSVLITNFSFDSVFSYLSTPMIDGPSSEPSFLDMIPDEPIPHEELAPLVEQIHSGYRCADLLVRLPGYIPLPSFYAEPSLPSYEWVDVSTNRMKPGLLRATGALLPSTASPSRTRSVIQAPLLVRPPSTTDSVYTRAGRSKVLSSIGIPLDLHDPDRTKILIVSFGGQVFKRPSSSSSRNSSRSHSRNPSHENVAELIKRPAPPFLGSEDRVLRPRDTNANANANANVTNRPPSPRSPSSYFDLKPLATPNHLWIPGAPPALKVPALSPAINGMMSPPTSPRDVPSIRTIPPTPFRTGGFAQDIDDAIVRHHQEGEGEEWEGEEGEGEENENEDGMTMASLLPDPSWIAVVCGVSKEQWNNSQTQGDGGDGDGDSGMPERFFVAPRDVYMPDLTAAADVLLGKLGYGTVSECVDACTPFVYVSRPLFIEEHGLRALLDEQGVGVELARSAYEDGDWAPAVSEAAARGAKRKAQKRAEMERGVGADTRDREGKRLAGDVVRWVRGWWGEDGAQQGKGEGKEKEQNPASGLDCSVTTR